MDSLPSEILSPILRYAAGHGTDDPSGLAEYAPVSRKWQAEVERITFRDLRVEASSDSHSNRANLYPLANVFQGNNVRRRNYLRSITVSYRLPRETYYGCCCQVEVTMDKETATKMWPAFLLSLFGLLSKLAERHYVYESKCQSPNVMSDGPQLPGICLIFEPAIKDTNLSSSPYLHSQPRWDEVELCDSTGPIHHTKKAIVDARMKQGTLVFEGLESLPELRDVSHFRYNCEDQPTFLRSTWIGKVLTKLPCLQNFTLGTTDYYHWGCDWRKQCRSDLDGAFKYLPTKSMEEMHLRVIGEFIFDENVPVHCLSMPDKDLYNGLLGSLSKFDRLRKLSLVGPLCVNPTLFQNSESGGSPGVRFPLLEEFTLEFRPDTSDGRWFFVRDDKVFTAYMSEDSDKFVVYGDSPFALNDDVLDNNRYRCRSDSNTLSPFLRDAASVCASMPRIKSFWLKVESTESSRWECLDFSGISRELNIRFTSGGTQCTDMRASHARDEIVTHSNRVTFHAGNYRPDEAVLRAWRRTVGYYGKVLLYVDERLENGPYRLGNDDPPEEMNGLP